MNGELRYSSLSRHPPPPSLPSSASDRGPFASLQQPSTHMPSLLHLDAKPVDLANAGRRQMMCLKDSEFFFASGSEIRMSSMGDVQESSGSLKAYKVRSHICYENIRLRKDPLSQANALHRHCIHLQYNLIYTKLP